MAVNLELLEELVAFKRYGTLMATAEHLMITQPTVTRGMKKLEDDLGVTLFDRSAKNRLVLTETGELAADEAAKLLQHVNDFEEKILNFDHLKNELPVSSTIPGPLMFLEYYQKEFPGKVQVNRRLLAPEEVVPELRNLKAKLVFSSQEIMTDEVESLYLGNEFLKVAIDPFDPLATHSSLTFKDLGNMSFLVFQDIGQWKKVIEDNIENANFLYQNDMNTMEAISQNSNFPFFISNLTQSLPSTTDRSSVDGPNRVIVSLDDPNNQMEVYASYLTSNRRQLQPLLKKLSQAWPKV